MVVCCDATEQPGGCKGSPGLEKWKMGNNEDWRNRLILLFRHLVYHNLFTVIYYS